MGLLVYITPNCERDAQTHGLTLDLARFRDRVEESQSTSLFDPFPPPYLVKKKLGGRQGRLIAELRTIGDHAVVVFLTILIRGSRAYESEFVVNPVAYGKQHLNFVTEGDVFRFIDERTRTAPPLTKREPSPLEYDFLYGAFSHHNGSALDLLILETKEWVERVSQDRISKHLALLVNPCRESLENSVTEPILRFLQINEKPGWGIWAMCLPGRVALLTPATETSRHDDETLAKAIFARLRGADESALLRACQRAYPAVILADDDLWIDLEKEPLANIALSPEESEILQSVRHSDPQSGFPLFINGRAGSGKSTILQYIFADLLFYYLSKQDLWSIASPLYLTASGDLLRHARSFVERLLRSEVTFSQQLSPELLSRNAELLDGAFRQFHPHLLSLLPQDERKDFGRPSRMDYGRFRRMWVDRFGREPRAWVECGPDLSWHVIRTYIKGMSSETYLEPDDYMQLPENQLTVSRDAFKAVYDRVWSGWYQGLRDGEGLWDDQDLARHVLDNDYVRAVHPAVVCDEAQDFTRLELELLLRLNMYSDRSVQPSDLHRIPFAFAGDHFQTLNPTGFRWDAIKASFVEKFIFELDPARRSSKVDLNYRELKFNYRSTDRIVKFGNSVQALRSALFQMPELRPQIPWSIEADALPVTCFYSNDGDFWKRFRENPGFVVIVPCGEDEEARFVQEDSTLRDNIRIEDGVPMNVLSAVRAKGFEYPAVIVYGFGAQLDSDITTHLPGEDGDSGSGRSLTLQYFMNRLYVAVSRPKQRLVIVDTDAGFQRFWRYIEDDELRSRILSAIKNGTRLWGSEIEGMGFGTPEALTRETTGSSDENARAFEADGRARNDAFLLRQAAQAYHTAGVLPKARECRARALEIEEKYYAAGEAFLEAGFAIPDGVRCFWCAGREGWERLMQESAADPRIGRQMEYQWARGIIKGFDPAAAIDLLSAFIQRLGADAAFAERCEEEPTWRQALSAILQHVIEAEELPSEGDDYWARLAQLIDRMRQHGLEVPQTACAQVYFWAKQYEKAITLWERAGDVRSVDYHQAKASVAPYPERLQSLAVCGASQQIVDLYRANRKIPLSPEQARAVCNALREVGCEAEAYQLAWTEGLTDSMLRLVSSALARENQDAAKTALQAAVFLLVRQQNWEPLLKVASGHDFVPSSEWQSKEYKRLTQEQTEVMKLNLVRALARSQGIVTAPPEIQQKISAFLRKIPRGKGGAEWKCPWPVMDAGAAIERSGRFTDALAFYDTVLNSKLCTAEEKQFARVRRLVNKQRQVKYEIALGAKDKARQIEHDLTLEMTALRIATIDGIEEYPHLSAIEAPLWPEHDLQPGTLEEAAAVASSVTTSIEESHRPESASFSAGAFRFEYSRKLQRCNVVHSDTMTTVFLKVAEGSIGGEVPFQQVNGAEWFCDSWKMRVRFPTEGQPHLLISMDALGLELQVNPT